MTDYEWSVAICLIDGNAYRKWLETHTTATAKQIAALVGQTGPQTAHKRATGARPSDPSPTESRLETR